MASARRTVLVIGLLGIVGVGCWPAALAAAQDAAAVLSPRNNEAPFCYVPDSERRWPILARPLQPGEQIRFHAMSDEPHVEQSDATPHEGLTITLGADGFLQIRAAADARAAFKLQIALWRGGTRAELQNVSIHRAPAPRAVSYVADLVDDLIRIFWDETAQQFRPIEKDGFDQYFRRLQAQGISRLVVWQSPFPLMVDRNNYSPTDWQNYEGQARAVIESSALTEAMRRSPGQKSYDWLRLLMRLRLSEEFASLFTASAAEHQIRLTASYRPFEPALAKYYQIPVFDSDGTYLWNFFPLASPSVNYHTEEVSFVHYREILRTAGQAPKATLNAIRIGGMNAAQECAQRAAQGQHDFQWVASPFPPLDEASYVLIRQPDGQFQLQPYRSIRSAAEAKRLPITGYTLRADGGHELVFEGLRAPTSHPYLMLESASEWAAELNSPVELDVALFSTEGNRLGRANAYCSLTSSDPAARETYVAGIPEDGNYRTEFQAIENSLEYFRARGQATWRLGEGVLVVHQGADTSIEMLDFERPAARAYAVRELRAILQWPAFDEVFVNTRSHTQLAASMADGDDGIQTVAHYRRAGKNYFHLGIDRAYAPRSVADQTAVRHLCTDVKQVESLTTWQPGEWQGPCQSATSPYTWRLERNRAVARGVRALLTDFESAFPDVRIRAVVPPSEAAEIAVRHALDEMPRPDGKPYGANYYQNIWSSLNHIPAIGEGMAMIDLSGLRVEPVFLGIRYLPDQGPLESFVQRSIDDLRGNRGSSYRGPRSFFYEAQETLRAAEPAAAAARRETIIAYLLSQREDVAEVLLYEAADWTYYLGSAEE